MATTTKTKSGFGGVSAAIRHPALHGFDDSIDLQTVKPLAAAHPNFSYHGGPVISCSTVYTTFWGSRWLSDPSHLARAARLSQFMKDFLASKYMNILSQYGAGTGAGGAGVFVQASFVNNVAADLTDANIHTVIQNMINVGALPEPVTPSHMALMIFLAEDVAVKDPALGIVMCEPNGDTAFGYHNFFTTNAGHNLAYSVIPGLQDACLTESCSSDVGCSLHLAETQEQRQTQVASHEYSEMVTDPELNAWFDATTGEENGDICNGEAGTVSFGSNTWTVQRMYSKHDDIATNGATTCILEAPNPIPKLSPGPAAGLSPAEHLRLMKPGSLDRLLPLPAVQYDANADAMRIDQEEMRLYAKRLSHPLPHTYLFANLPEFLRTMADAIK